MTSKSKPKTQANNLEEEIEMLRKAVRQSFQLCQEVEDPQEKLRLLGTLGATASRLANLVKIQHQLNQGKGTEMDELIKAALDEVARELGLPG
jgi:hypothetical protein